MAIAGSNALTRREKTTGQKLSKKLKDFYDKLVHKYIFRVSTLALTKPLRRRFRQEISYVRALEVGERRAKWLNGSVWRFIDKANWNALVVRIRA